MHGDLRPSTQPREGPHQECAATRAAKQEAPGTMTMNTHQARRRAACHTYTKQPAVRTRETVRCMQRRKRHLSSLHALQCGSTD